MPVTETKIKLRDEMKGPNTLELQPNSFSGHGSYEREITVTIHDGCDKPLGHVSVNIDEIRHAIDVCEMSHFDGKELINGSE
jgi:hypothetical protein